MDKEKLIDAIFNKLKGDSFYNNELDVLYKGATDEWNKNYHYYLKQKNIAIYVY